MTTELQHTKCVKLKVHSNTSILTVHANTVMRYSAPKEKSKTSNFGNF